MSPSEALQRELRAARPSAPAELRERVRLVVAEEPEPARRPSFVQRLSPRRFLLVAAPAMLVVAVAAAGVIGLTRPGSPDEVAVSGGGAEPGVVQPESDSDGSLESGRAFTALSNAGHSVSMISQASSEASICFVLPGDESAADRSLSPDERTILGAYLAGGGHLVLSGSEIGFDLDATRAQCVGQDRHGGRLA